MKLLLLRTILLALSLITSITFSLSAQEKKQTPLQGSNPKWEFAIATIFRDEARYLGEWIELHKLAGAEHFYLFSHLSTDNYLDVLQPYIANGEVELFEWNETYDSANKWSKIQISAYEHARKLAAGKVKWLACLDTDEFLFSTSPRTIPENLQLLLNKEKDPQKIGAFKLHWLMFGTSNVAKIPDNQTLIESLTLCQGQLHPRFKSITRPECVTKILSAHHVQLKEGYKTFAKSDSIYGYLQLNHYWTRDEDFYNNVKIPRESKWGRNIHWCRKQAEHFNDVSDIKILHYVPALRAKLGLPDKKTPSGDL